MKIETAIFMPNHNHHNRSILSGKLTFVYSPIPHYLGGSMNKKNTEKRIADKRIKKQSSAGRPKGTGKFGCDTKVIRVPVHLVDEIFSFIQHRLNR
jgi:hypothetical protein